ncbi:MAG: DUF3320 domain-containing protein [Candidatus Odinarchaeota archaeon]
MTVIPNNFHKQAEELLNSWQKRVIDTSKRNILLNFKPTVTRHFQIISEYPDQLFQDLFINRAKFHLIWAENPPLIKPEKSILRIVIESSDYYRRLKYLYREARKVIAETSINILYVAMGTLEYSDPKTGNSYQAPLILIPVEIVPVKKNVKLTYPELSPDQKPFFPKSIFQIRHTDDDIVTNPALIHVFETDHGIMIPEFNENEEQAITDYFASLNEIFAGRGISIKSDVYLGFYSFHRFTIYQDILKHKELILNNQIFQQIAGRVVSGPNAVFFDDDQLDTIERPLETFHVLDADSSQRKAIMLAEKGKNFVLQGPPGTGKSQTITNIIAEFIANGKSVLFVSEKKAALDVVYKRLLDHGLGEYLLDLHSTKETKKRDFYTKLGLLLAKRESQLWEISKEVSKQLKELEKKRKTLNDITNLVNTPLPPFNRTLFEIYGRLALLDMIPALKFLSEFKTITESSYLQSSTSFEELQQYGELIAEYGKSIWRYYNKPDFDEVIRNQLKSMFITFKDTFTGFNRSWTRTCEVIGLGIPVSYLSQRSYWLWQKYFGFFSENDTVVPVSWLLHPRIREQGSRILDIEDIRRKLELFSELSGFLDENYSENVFQLPLSSFKELLETRYSRWWKRFFRKKDYQKIVHTVTEYSKLAKYTGLKHSKLLSDVRKLLTYKDLKMWKSEKEESIKNLLGDYYLEDETNWSMVTRLLDVTSERTKVIHGIIEDLDIKGMAEIKEIKDGSEKHIKLSFAEAKLALYFSRKTEQTVKSELEKLVAENDSFFHQIETIITILDELFELQLVTEELVFGKIELYCYEIEQSIDRAPKFIHLNLLLKKIKEEGNLDFFDEYIQKGYPIKHLTRSYEKQVYLAIVKHYHKKIAELRWSGDKRDRLVTSFSDLDLYSIEMAPYRIHSEIYEVDSSSWLSRALGESGFLLREYEKKRLHKPIRVAFRQAPQKILQLKPVMFLSPLSLSFFLDPELVTFDLAIFDEASQVPPEQALGAIIRAKQVIVVGDSKQMPPTRFFAASTGEEEFDIDEYEYEDDSDPVITMYQFDSVQFAAESILEALNFAAGFPTHTLRYHYRSKHESLIAFSNSYFYDNRLITFPSPMKEHPSLGIELVYVPDGIYDRGHSRTNRREAEKVVEIVKNLINSETSPSIGIVAFSQAQERAIESAFEKHEDLEAKIEELMDAEHDPLFIKNLETVQGDERDYIIISVGYGRDKNGRFLKNFGPVTQFGGERRFNVLISRAREKIFVITSVHPGDYPEGSKNKNFEIVRQYLLYAGSNDELYLKNVQDEHLKDKEISEPLLIDAVANFLKDHGYEVETRVGTSESRIDLTVVHPETGQYVIAIELDGPSYQQSRTARDRDRLRESFLRKLGWKYYRLWSNEWISDPENASKKLLNAVKSAFEGHLQDIEELKEKLKEITQVENNVEWSEKELPPIVKIVQIMRNYATGERYRVARVPRAPIGLSLTANYHRRSANYRDRIRTLEKQINHVVKVEAPIHREILVRRILDGWEQIKLTAKAKVTITEVLDGIKSIHGFDKFYWIDANQREKWTELPVRDHASQEIGIIRVAPEEIAALMTRILQESMSIEENQLVKEICTFYGKKPTDKRVYHLKKALRLVENRKLVKEIDGYIRWKGQVNMH